MRIGGKCYQDSPEYCNLNCVPVCRKAPITLNTAWSITHPPPRSTAESIHTRAHLDTPTIKPPARSRPIDGCGALHSVRSSGENRASSRTGRVLEATLILGTLSGLTWAVSSWRKRHAWCCHWWQRYPRNKFGGAPSSKAWLSGGARRSVLGAGSIGGGRIGIRLALRGGWLARFVLRAGGERLGLQGCCWRVSSRHWPGWAQASKGFR